MIWHQYTLDDAVFKTAEELTLWQSDKGLVKVSKDTLAVAVKSNSETVGYAFHGEGKMILDAIVETEQGAAGKSIEKELNKPLLMLGNPEQIADHLAPADTETCSKKGYSEARQFVETLGHVFRRFLRTERGIGCYCSVRPRGLVFAFVNEDGKKNLLLVKDSKIVYKSHEMVYVYGDNKAIIRSPQQIVVSRRDKSVIVNR